MDPYIPSFISEFSSVCADFFNPLMTLLFSLIESDLKKYLMINHSRQTNVVQIYRNNCKLPDLLFCLKMT